MIRNLWLKNGEGDIYDLTNKVDESFLGYINGFGVENNIASTRLNTAEIVTSAYYELPNISGNIYFLNKKGNAYKYQNYQEFFIFCNKFPLFIYYEPPHLKGHPVKKQVILKSLEKSEISHKSRALECPVVFQSLSFWVTDEEEVIVVSDAMGTEGKKYPYTRPYNYVGDSFQSIRLYNSSPQEVPIEIEINDTFENLTYNLYDYTGELYGTGAIVGNYDYCLINAHEPNERIVLRNDGKIVENSISKQDFSYARKGARFVFLYLKPGESIMSFGFDERPKKIKISYPKGVFASV